MSDYDRDRGAYSPSGEAPLAFDARDPAGRGAGRPPTTLIISALLLLVAVLGLLFIFRNGVRHPGEPPVVGQPLQQIRQAPPSSSQPADEAAGLQIYGAGHEPPASAAPGFAPPPEEPLPRQAQSPPPPEAPAAAPPQSQAAEPGPAPAVQPPPAQVKASAQVKTSAPPPAQAKAVAPPAPRPAPPAQAALAPAPPTPVQAATAAPGAAVVQIGAFSSTTLADKGWSDVARLIPGQMVGRTKKVETFVKGTETFYRAYVGGFGSKAEAGAFCGQLKAAGHDCLVK
jgi:hypothetical protein